MQFAAKLMADRVVPYNFSVSWYRDELGMKVCMLWQEIIFHLVSGCKVGAANVAAFEEDERFGFLGHLPA